MDAGGGSCSITYTTFLELYPLVLKESAGTENPYHGCEVCDPSTSTTEWTTAPDGTPCAAGAGKCVSGACSGGAVDGAACGSGWDCESDYCAVDEMTLETYCNGSVGQPYSECVIQTDECAYGLVCMPVTGCNPYLGSVCIVGYSNPCL